MKKILFLNGQTDKKWLDSLLRASSSLGKSLIPEDYQHIKTRIRDCEMVLIDSEMIHEEELMALLKRIHTASAATRIVVVSSSPTWKQARELLLAGASDYVKKTDDQKTLQGILSGHASTLILGNIPAGIPLERS